MSYIKSLTGTGLLQLPTRMRSRYLVFLYWSFPVYILPVYLYNKQKHLHEVKSTIIIVELLMES